MRTMFFIGDRASKGLLWWLSQQRICLQCRRLSSTPGSGRFPWRREWLPAPVFLTGEFHGQSSLAGSLHPCGHKQLDTIEWLVQFSRSVVSNSLQPHGLQHARPPCPSPSPGVYPNSCPLNQWYQSNHLILCCPLLLLPSIFPSIRVFSNESIVHIRWPKYWSLSFSISPSSKYSGPISFRME